MSDEDFKRPVCLDINNSGAWKRICRFDATDSVTLDQVIEATAMLARITPCKWRIRIDDSLNIVLMYYTPETGWKEA